MRLLMVSGIFAASPEFRATNLQETPDSLLAQGLERAGVDVVTRGPRIFDDWRGFDIVHLFHLQNSCARTMLPVRQKVVFTRFGTKDVPRYQEMVRRAVYRRADRVVVTNPDEIPALEGLVDASRIVCINQGMRTDRFTTVLRRPPTDGEPWILLYVGQLIELKRVHLAIEMLRRLKDAGRDARLRIVSHRDTLGPELEALAGELGVADRVEFVGPRPRAGIAEDMARAHFLVHPSRTEATSTVIGEAVISGLPVLAFAVSGVDEQVPTGYEMPPVQATGRLSELALARMADYDAIAQQFMERAAHVRSTYSIDDSVARHLRMYREILT